MEFNQDFIWLLGVAVLAYISYRKKALNISGAVASFVIGGVITFAFSLYGLLLLAGFFLSSTLLGRILKIPGVRHEEFEEKGETRDGRQVVANGGWAAVASLIFLLTGNPGWFLAFVASLAAANSDTWASTIGKRSSIQPKMVFTGEIVSPGQSGGTTLRGNAGAMAGSTFIVMTAIMFQFLSTVDSFTWFIWLLIVLVGFASQWIDAVAGAFLQSLYYCDTCQRYTEKQYHCKERTKLVKGFKWINNDIVNHFCTFSAFLTGGIIGIYF
ncbi:DUF92 domain-containing protein [Salipaludibacillus sp. HK11]|uniref:DUF92 domain-containing protein n=1 Tax=Salipaludibacillus sp. HK11 TaxID=3394320 RepID=UPI0039FC702B